MTKENIFCTTAFYMGEDDILHVLITDESGTPPEIHLYNVDDTDNPEDGTPLAVVALPATPVSGLYFYANWEASALTTGYYLDVATDSAFTSLVSGFNKKDVGNVLTYQVTGLDVETLYYYRVTAYNATLESDMSNTITVVTTSALYNRWVTQKFNDWFLPSKDELNQIYVNLYLYSLGSLYPDGYPSSSEALASTYWTHAFSTNIQGTSAKSNGMNVRPIRSFTTSSGTSYALRSTGPAGGLIFYINNNGGGTWTYYEAYTVDVNLIGAVGWSDVNSLAGTATGIGEGKNNTDLIVAQSASDLMASRCKSINIHDIAPIGWHIGSNTEIGQLATDIGGYAEGGKLKETGFVFWESPNTGATNELGFNARAGGKRLSNGIFASLRTSLLCWLTNTYSSGGQDYGVMFQLFSFISTFNANGGDLYNCGHTLIFIKDDSIDPGTVTDIDGNITPTVKIGLQVFMTKKPKVTKFNDSIPIPLVTNNAAWAALTTPGMCYYTYTL